jgi:hypothetical protein
MGLEKYVLSPAAIGKLRTNPPELAARLQSMLADYHRAHLVGPGFGDELFEGIMLAPRGFNLGAQNEGVEDVVRAMHAAGRDISLDLHATGTRLAIPLADGTFEHVDILRSVTYVIHEEGKPPLRVVLGIDAPPRARWTIIHSDIVGLTEEGIDKEKLLEKK